MGSADEKLISLETALHLRIFFGTRASCSSPGSERSSLPCHKIFPVSASLRFIQLTWKPFRMSSALGAIVFYLVFSIHTFNQEVKNGIKILAAKSNWSIYFVVFRLKELIDCLVPWVRRNHGEIVECGMSFIDFLLFIVPKEKKSGEKNYSTFSLLPGTFLSQILCVPGSTFLHKNCWFQNRLFFSFNAKQPWVSVYLLFYLENQQQFSRMPDCFIKIDQTLYYHEFEIVSDFQD